MTFRCPNGQYYSERIPLSQNIEYRVSDAWAKRNNFYNNKVDRGHERNISRYLPNNMGAVQLILLTLLDPNLRPCNNFLHNKVEGAKTNTPAKTNTCKRLPITNVLLS